MKAVVQTRQGPPEVLVLREVEKPVPGSDEVLVRVRAATVTIGDTILRRIPAPLLLLMRLFGIRRKTIPGHEFSGEVEAVGRDVERFGVGDPVFGTTTGLRTGANAEYVSVPQARKSGVVAGKPTTMTFEEAAAVPIGGMTALQILRKGAVQSGHKVLVYGASGSVGTFAVQLARHFGAEVTGVCSGANAELVKSLGAAAVLDYTREDFAAGGATYDVIFDAVGKTSRSRCRGALAAGGRFLSVRSLTSEKTEDLLFLKELAEAGAIRSVIDRRYPLERAAEAHRYVETGRKKGNVILTLDPPEAEVRRG